jgi:hypothetical protein
VFEFTAAQSDGVSQVIEPVTVYTYEKAVSLPSEKIGSHTFLIPKNSAYLIIKGAHMIVLREQTFTFESLVEVLLNKHIRYVEVYSKSGSYLMADFEKQGKIVAFRDGIQIQNKSGYHLLTLYKKSVRKIEHDPQGWDVLLTSGDNWRIHIL